MGKTRARKSCCPCTRRGPGPGGGRRSPRRSGAYRGLEHLTLLADAVHRHRAKPDARALGEQEDDVPSGCRSVLLREHLHHPRLGDALVHGHRHAGAKADRQQAERPVGVGIRPAACATAGRRRRPAAERHQQDEARERRANSRDGKRTMFRGFMGLPLAGRCRVRRTNAPEGPPLAALIRWPAPRAPCPSSHPPCAVRWPPAAICAQDPGPSRCPPRPSPTLRRPPSRWRAIQSTEQALWWRVLSLPVGRPLRGAVRPCSAWPFASEPVHRGPGGRRDPGEGAHGDPFGRTLPRVDHRFPVANPTGGAARDALPDAPAAASVFRALRRFRRLAPASVIRGGRRALIARRHRRRAHHRAGLFDFLLRALFPGVTAASRPHAARARQTGNDPPTGLGSPASTACSTPRPAPHRAPELRRNAALALEPCSTARKPPAARPSATALPRGWASYRTPRAPPVPPRDSSAGRDRCSGSTARSWSACDACVLVPTGVRPRRRRRPTTTACRAAQCRTAVPTVAVLAARPDADAHALVLLLARMLLTHRRPPALLWRRTDALNPGRGDHRQRRDALRAAAAAGHTWRVSPTSAPGGEPGARRLFDDLGGATHRDPRRADARRRARHPRGLRGRRRMGSTAGRRALPGTAATSGQRAERRGG